MEFVNIGKLVNTHGVRGEVRIISDINEKDQVFKIGQNIYLGKNKDMHTISTYRVHKNYDMLTFEGVYNINDVLKYKGMDVFVNRDDISSDILLRTDLINMDAYFNQERIGTVKNILISKAHDILEISGNKKLLIPYIDNYILKVDNEKKEIHFKSVEVFLNED